MPQEWTLPVRRVPAPLKVDTSIVWNNLSVCYEQQMFGPVNDIAYSFNGEIVGLVSTNQLTIMRVPHSEGTVVNDQSERKTFSINFRHDDKLYLESIDQRVALKSCETAFERQFCGHTRDVRKSLFLNKHHFISCSDDTTVRLWNILQENELATGVAHHDYVRALATLDDNTFFSGSYDHSVNLWDVRTGLSTPVATTANLLPNMVENLCIMNTCNYLACANGEKVTFFDTRKSMINPLHEFSIHTKTVSSLAFSKKYNTLFTAALDGRVKMSSFNGSEILHLSTKKLNYPVTAIGVHTESKEFAVGGATGSVVIFKLDNSDQEGRNEKELEEKSSASMTNIHDVVYTTIDEQRGKKIISKTEESMITLQNKVTAVQQQLRSHQYNKAVRTALYSRQIDVIMSTIEELLRRGVLHIALSNQNDRTIVRLLRFASEHIAKTSFVNTMIAVIEDVVLIYATMISKSVLLHREMQKLQKQIATDLDAIMEAKDALSMMELIVNN